MRRRWSEDEELVLESFLINPDGDNFKSIADLLERSENSVRNKARRLRNENSYLRNRFQRKFAMSEVQFIKDNYNTMSAKAIATRLRRTPKTVMNKANELGIRKQKDLASHDERIRKMARRGNTAREIAIAINSNDKSIRDYLYRNGIDFRKTSQSDKAKAFRNSWGVR